MRFAVGGSRGTKVLGLCAPPSTSVALRARATHTRMLSWRLRRPNNNYSEIVRIVLFVALLTRHGTVPGALGQVKPGTKSKKTAVRQAQATAAVWACDARVAFLLQVRKYLLPVGFLPMGSNISIFLWVGRKMTYDDHCKLYNPMDTKGPRMCSESSL